MLLIIGISISLSHFNFFSLKIGKDIKRPRQLHCLCEITFSLTHKHFKYIDFCQNMATGNNCLLQQETILVAETISQQRCLYYAKKVLNSDIYSYNLLAVCSVNQEFFKVGERAAKIINRVLVEYDSSWTFIQGLQSQNLSIESLNFQQTSHLIRNIKL